MSEIRSALRDALMNMGGMEQTGNIEWIQFRCVFCGDSQSSNNKHLNIRVALDNSPMLIICYQPSCIIQGLLTKQHLERLGITNDALLDYTAKHETVSKRFFKSNIKNNWFYPYMRNEKLLYNERRMGVMLSIDDVQKYRMVLDINEFLTVNSITLTGAANLSTLEMVKNDYVGLVNTEGSQIRFRYIGDKPYARKFTTITLVDVPVHSPYSINESDIFHRETKNVHIVEGGYDALNVSLYFKIKPTDEVISTNSIKAMSKNLNRILNKNSNVKLIIYLDEGILPQHMLRMLNKSWIAYKIKHPILFRRNISAKDFGDVNEKWELHEEEYHVDQVIRKPYNKKKVLR